jgi:SAM-dependent methyltransferase
MVDGLRQHGGALVSTFWWSGARAGRKRMNDDWRAINRAHWDERVPIHLRSRLYDVESFKAGHRPLAPAQVRDLAPVAGKTLIHLQCHFGLDTLNWARLGAEVTGLDFSAPALAAARRLAGELGIAATFVEADVYDAPTALKTTYDIVYTGVGALMWLPDIARWAAVVAALLKPGGELYLVEFHPTAWMLAEDDPFAIDVGYFTPADGFAYVDAGSYANREATTSANEARQWNHPLGEVVTALIRAGLTLRELRESDESYLQRWPMLEQTEGQLWRMPAQLPSLPLMYTLRAVK